MELQRPTTTIFRGPGTPLSNSGIHLHLQRMESHFFNCFVVIWISLPAFMLTAIKTIILLGTCCCFLNIHAQVDTFSSRADALRKLKTATHDSSRQQVYNYIGASYLKQAEHQVKLIDSAIIFLRKSVYLFDSVNVHHSALTNTALTSLAEAYLRKEELVTGSAIMNQVINSYRITKDKRREAQAWYSRARWIMDGEIFTNEIDTGLVRSLSLYRQLNDSAEVIRIGLELAFYNFRAGRSAEAREQLLSLAKFSRQYHSFMLPVAFLHLAVMNRYSGNYEQGLGYALNAEKAMEETSDTSTAHNVYGELALEYQELNRPAESVSWYRKCLEKRKRIGCTQSTIYRTMYLMIVQMLKTGMSGDAVKLINQLAHENPPRTPYIEAVLSQSLAYCYNATGQYNLAEHYFLRMDSLYKLQLVNGEFLFVANCDIARFYLSRGKYTTAGIHLAKAFKMERFATMPLLKDLHLMMFRVDSANHNLASALAHYQQYKQLSDSIFQQANRKQLQELVINYEVEKKDNNLRVFEKENKLQQTKLSKAHQARNWMIAGGSLMLVIMLLLIHNSRIKQRANKMLTSQKKEISRQNESLQHLVREKDWLVREIHHRVKNNFQMVIGLLGTQTGYLKGEEAMAALADSRHRVQAMSLIHQRLYQSDRLSAINIAAYIHELVDYLKESFTSSARIRFQVQVDAAEMNLANSIPLGLILNEAITNAIKYAFPGKQDGVISISLRQCDEPFWQLQVADNGIGLPAGMDPVHAGSMGMKLMYGLAEDLDGALSIHVDDGTCVSLRFSIFPEPDHQSTSPITTSTTGV
ncbi:MAG: sensor histidine kinase [Chitinophagaceae bacterium]|nr:MAG: sensor histidine kinase [Chitinophagaceae bacterium]